MCTLTLPGEFNLLLYTADEGIALFAKYSGARKLNSLSIPLLKVEVQHLPPTILICTEIKGIKQEKASSCGIHIQVVSRDRVVGIDYNEKKTT